MKNADYEPAFLDDDGPSKDLPTFISTTNARELFGLKEGETILDAMARNTSAKAASNAAVNTQKPICQTSDQPKGGPM